MLKYTVVLSYIDWESRDSVPCVYEIDAPSRVEAVKRARAKTKDHWGHVHPDAEASIVAVYYGRIENPIADS